MMTSFVVIYFGLAYCIDISLDLLKHFLSFDWLLLRASGCCWESYYIYMLAQMASALIFPNIYMGGYQYIIRTFIIFYIHLN